MVEGSKPSGPAYRFILDAGFTGTVKEISIELKDSEIRRGAEIRGTVTVSFPAYDGVVINAQILNSNEHVRYTSYNGTKVQQVARLFVGRDRMPDNKVEFTASVDFEPEEEHEVKFRASIIEQHKEISSDIIFARYL